MELDREQREKILKALPVHSKVYSTFSIMDANQKTILKKGQPGFKVKIVYKGTYWKKHPEMIVRFVGIESLFYMELHQITCDQIIITEKLIS